MSSVSLAIIDISFYHQIGCLFELIIYIFLEAKVRPLWRAYLFCFCRRSIVNPGWSQWMKPTYNLELSAGIQWSIFILCHTLIHPWVWQTDRGYGQSASFNVNSLLKKTHQELQLWHIFFSKKNWIFYKKMLLLSALCLTFVVSGWPFFNHRYLGLGLPMALHSHCRLASMAICASFSIWVHWRCSTSEEKTGDETRPVTITNFANNKLSY